MGGAYDGSKYIWTASKQVVTGATIRNEVLQYTTDRPNLYWNGYWKGLNSTFECPKVLKSLKLDESSNTRVILILLADYDLRYNGAPMMGFTCTSH